MKHRIITLYHTIGIIIIEVALRLSLPFWCLFACFSSTRSTEGSGTPILLVHGYLMNRACMLCMMRQLRKRTIGPLYTITLTPKMGSITTFANQIAEKAASIEKESGKKKIILIGHSMGGVAATYYAENIAPKKSVEKVITVGSPLAGTIVAFFGGGRCSREMHHNSSFTSILRKQSVINPSTIYHHIGSLSDQIIIPRKSAFIEEHPERNTLIPHHGHLQLIFSRKVIEVIANLLS